MQNLNDVPPLKALSPMCVTVRGRKTDSIDVQPLKAASPMNSRLRGNWMNLRESQPSKAPYPIRVTVSGIVTRYQGSTTIESPHLDDVNGRSKDDFRDIYRGFFITETMISVDSRCEVWNAI